jgi:hypothetical protein
MKTTSVIIVILLLNTIGLSAQDPGKKMHQSISFKSGFIQIKDEFNYGLVNNGLDLAGEYALTLPGVRKTFAFKAGLSFGANYKQGLGLAWSCKPLDVYYGFRLNNNPLVPLTLGPYVAGYYMWQLYPELQSGKMFWLSSYELGPRILISLPVKNRTLHLSVSSSLASLNSRPEMKTEEYYYSLTFADFITNPHSNMTFGFLDVFNHTQFILELADPDKKMSVAYEFNYIGYLNPPNFKYLSHSILLKWKIGTKKLKS